MVVGIKLPVIQSSSDHLEGRLKCGALDLSHPLYMEVAIKFSGSATLHTDALHHLAYLQMT
jgi:hypothetical protein